MVETEVAGDQKGPAVELDQNGKTLTLPIKGKLTNKKWQPDGQLLSRAKSLKAGTAVLFSTHTEDGKTYSGVVTLEGPNALNLKGCALGFICKGETWQRMK